MNASTKLLPARVTHAKSIVNRAWQMLQEEEKQSSHQVQAQLARKFITEKMLNQRHDKTVSGKFVDFETERA